MKLRFRLQYHTQMGESLAVKLLKPIAGFPDLLPLNYLNAKEWGAEVEVLIEKNIEIHYQYILIDKNNGLELEEWKPKKTILSADKKIIELMDTWSSAGTLDYPLSSTAFDKLLKKPKIEKLTKPKEFTHHFQLFASGLKADERICILGNTKALNGWDIEKPIVLKQTQTNIWEAYFDFSGVFYDIEYKYGIYNQKGKRFVGFEQGDNRKIYAVHSENYQISIKDERFNYHTEQLWKGAGVAIPVFSIRTENGLGVGEFLDLKVLADWAKKTQMKLIQILPINDTIAQQNWVDSYPYAAISVFALHPQYLNIENLPYKKTAVWLKKYNVIKDKLNALPFIDYEEVMSNKIHWAKEIYLKNKTEFLADETFQKFFLENEYWLKSYATFSYLRDLNQTPDFSLWKKYSTYNAKEIEKLIQPKSKEFEEIAFYYFLQFHLHQQLKEATEYIHKQGIILKGDIPIGIYRYSCDAWVSQDLYNMNRQAGAPPDDFSVKGQNWGFPTYNWEKMATDNYQWWKDRFTQLSQYFDAFRIDHILGFFRIWQIPMEATEGILGYFEPALAMNEQEINSWGIYDVEKYAKPFINDHILQIIAPNHVEIIKKEYLEKNKNDEFQLKEFINTQRKIVDYFKEKEDKILEQALLDLVANVLFITIKDNEKIVYHPRCLAHHTAVFSLLLAHEKDQMQKLYNHYFYERNEKLWQQKGFEKLPAIAKSTKMLICGEDLGMVPACVSRVMGDLGILGLEVQRMPKSPKDAFVKPYKVPYLSVITTSSHDTSTLRGWWKEDKQLTQKYYNEILGHFGEAPPDCSPELVTQIIQQHLYSPAIWMILPMQDYLGIDEKLRWANEEEERVNIPAIIPHYWRYRMHLTVENLIKKTTFTKKIANLISESKR